MKQFDIFFDNDNKLYQVRTKTDTTTIEFTDSEKELIFKDLIRLYDTRDKISFSTIQKLLNKADYNKLLDVVKELQECGILDELNFEAEGATVISDIYNEVNHKPVSEMKIAYIGNTDFGNQVKEKSSEYNIEHFVIYSIDELSDETIESILCNSDFIIVDSLTWNPYKGV